MIQAELKVTSGKQAGSAIPLPEGKFLVGREEDCHLRPNSEMVSRHHCVFTVDEFTCRLRDLGSTNGTFVNGERIRGAVLLKNGDRVSIGKLDFQFVLHDAVSQETSSNLSLEQGTQADIPQIAPGTVVDAEGTPLGQQPSNSDTLTEIPTNLADALPPPHGDTQFALPQQPMQMQPPVGYPMGYPQQYMPYGYPMGYPQQMGYPPQMGYPQMGMGMYPGMQMPGQPMAMPQEQPAQPAATGNNLETKLPDPSQTGAKPPEPKPTTPGQASSGPGMKDAVGDVINKYLNRRPGS